MPTQFHEQNFFYNYLYIKNGKVRIYKKKSYLRTLPVSQKPFYTVYKNKDIKSDTPTSVEGSKTSIRAILHNVKDKMKTYIECFPKIESNYNKQTLKNILRIIDNLQINHDFDF